MYFPGVTTVLNLTIYIEVLLPKIVQLRYKLLIQNELLGQNLLTSVDTTLHLQLSSQKKSKLVD